MPKAHHFAFKKEYPNLSLRLTTEAEVFGITTSKTNMVTALWDTGAMVSAITPVIAQGLSLFPINRVKVNGVNNISLADVAIVALNNV